MLSRTPGARVSQLRVYIFFIGNDLGNRKTLPVSVIGAVLGKGSTGHTEGSNRGNSEILANLGRQL